MNVIENVDSSCLVLNTKNETVTPTEPQLAATSWLLGFQGYHLLLVERGNREAVPFRSAVRAKCGRSLGESGGIYARRLGCPMGREEEDIEGLGVETSFGWPISLNGLQWLWGQMVRHDCGWRAQFAYPAAFALYTDIDQPWNLEPAEKAAGWLAADYGVPVAVCGIPLILRDAGLRRLAIVARQRNQMEFISEIVAGTVA